MNQDKEILKIVNWWFSNEHFHWKYVYSEKDWW